VSIIYKYFLKATNENLDNLVPSWWEFHWSTTTQVVAMLSTLAAVTHGVGVTLAIQREGILLWPWRHRIINRFDCTEVLRKMGYNGRQVCVCWGKGRYSSSINSDKILVNQIFPFLLSLACLLKQPNLIDVHTSSLLLNWAWGWTTVEHLSFWLCESACAWEYWGEWVYVSKSNQIQFYLSHTHG
jgi:hypothetical protein